MRDNYYHNGMRMLTIMTMVLMISNSGADWLQLQLT